MARPVLHGTVDREPPDLCVDTSHRILSHEHAISDLSNHTLSRVLIPFAFCFSGPRVRSHHSEKRHRWVRGKA